MFEQDRRHLMEYILELQAYLRENGLEADQLIQAQAERGLPDRPEGRLRAACELVRFMDDMPGGFLIYYADGGEELVYANRAALRMFGCESMEQLREQTGDSFRGLVHPEDLDRVERSIHSQISSGNGDLDYVEYRIVRRDGTVRWIEDYGRCVRGEEAQRDAFYVFLGDATGKHSQRMDQELQRELEQKQMLAQALDSARQAISAKDVFLSNMSHDMRTPLNAIFGFLTLARQNSGDQEAVLRYLGRIETSARQLLDLISKVLELSQTESGGARPAEDECDLVEIIRETCDFLRPQAVEKNIDFTVDCSGVVHRAVIGDREKVGQLLMYLANNALTYTNPGGRVTVSARELEERSEQYARYRLSVEDTGIGVSEEFLARIFEPFARERNTTLSGIHGIGLGLTIAKNIVEMMNGTIEVKSAVGEGSTFAATLRFRLQSAEEDAGAAELPPGEARRSILLVEDNEINREIETEILQELGFAVDTAEDGSVGVEKLKRAGPGRYDLVLMDIQMPVMDGWQAARAIRALPDPALARIPIIALSANVFESDMRRSAQSGMDAHLPKPLDVPQLLAAIEALDGGEVRTKDVNSHE